MADEDRGRVSVTLREREAVNLILPDGRTLEVYVSRVQADGRASPRVTLSVEAPKDVIVARR